MQSNFCSHARWVIVNPWEYLRKYRCEDCAGIALCACDRDFAERLPHQATRVTNPDPPYEELNVTLGMLPDVCPSCRGEVESPYPRADGWGSPSVLRRYYWREIAREAYVSFHEEGFPPPSVWKEAQGRVRRRHELNPVYDLTRHERGTLPAGIERRVIEGEYVRGTDGVGRWNLEGKAVRVEELVMAHLLTEGWTVQVSERRLPSSLFATFMGIVTLDVTDPLQRMSGFGLRDGSKEFVWSYLPRDHHSPQWFARRHDVIRDHVAALIEDDEWEWLLDYWWDAWTIYRHYLWAHNEAGKQLVHTLIEYERGKLGEILLYLAEDYWGRYTGWPDLLGTREEELRLFEVKGPNDRPSEDQLRWFNDNELRLGLPVTIINVKRR